MIPLDLDIDAVILQDALEGLEPLPLNQISSAIDFGAHAGAVTCTLASQGIRVLAVEPLQIARLARNIEKNQLQRHVSIIQAAVAPYSSKKPLLMKLRRAGNDAMCGTRFLEDRSLDEGRALRVTPSQVSTLFGRVADFVKVDIEGAEWDLLVAREFSALFSEAKYVDLELHGESEFFPEGFTHGFDVPLYMYQLGFELMETTKKQQLWKHK